MSGERKKPSVSAIIPTFERPEILQRALESVSNQTHPKIEVIVVETPSSVQAEKSDLKRVAEYPLIHIKSGPDVGASEARNIGIEHSSGDYIAFLDDDDEWFPDKTARQVSEMESRGVSASVTGKLNVDSGADADSVYHPPDPDDQVQYQLCWNIGTFSMLMINSAVPERIGGLDTQLPRREDQDYLLRIAREFEIATISEPLVRKHTGDYPQLGSDYEALRSANARFREKHGDLASDYGVYGEMAMSFEFSLGRTALVNGDYGRAQRHFWNAIRRKPTDRGLYLYLLAAIGGPVTYEVGKKVRQRGWL